MIIEADHASSAAVPQNDKESKPVHPRNLRYTLSGIPAEVKLEREPDS